jgi:hypothetical protein
MGRRRGQGTIVSWTIVSRNAIAPHLGALSVELRQSLECALDSWFRAFFKWDSFAAPAASLSAFFFSIVARRRFSRASGIGFMTHLRFFSDRIMRAQDLGSCVR